MKKKIVGILVITLLMTSVCSALGTVLDKEIKTVKTDFVVVTKLKSNDLKLDDIIVDYSENGDVLDQQQPTSCGKVFAITNQQWLAQSFKPSLEVLTRVELWIFKYGNPSDTEEITVSIRENLAGSDKVTLTIDTSPISNQWVEFDFTDMDVTPDDTYHIVVRADGGDNDNYYGLNFDVNNPYNRGEGWWSPDGGSDWILSDYPEYPECDYCFKTYGFNRNQPPNTPINPSPENHATDIDIDSDLSWTGGDPDEGDTVIYDIYFGDANPPPLEKSDHPDTNYNPGTMEPSTAYYWYIIASDNHDATCIGPLWDFTTADEDVNQPPNKPSITGPTSGKAGDPHTYSVSAIDPDGDEVFFWFDWDDGNEVGWLGKYSSGEICNLSHTWQAEGSYNIKVKAKDTNDLESDWTSLSVSMPRNKLLTLYQRFMNKIPRSYSLLKQLFSFPIFSKMIISDNIDKSTIKNPVDTDLDDCNSCVSKNNDYKYSLMRPDYETLQKWIEAYNNAPETFIDPEIHLLDSKNLLSHLDYTPSQRNQGSCGNCWTWAGTGVLGIALDVQEGIHDRLSVQYINSCQSSTIGKTCCTGGWLEDFSDFYAIKGKAIPWSNTNAHWQDGDDSCDTSCGSISTIPNYGISSISHSRIPTHGVSESTAISRIKNVLNQNKAVWFAFFMATDADWDNFGSFWWLDSESSIWSTDFSCGHSWNDGGGHAVLCVGYNDGPGTSNDYWIMLNSWGTADGGRPNGLFRVDMHIDYDCMYYRGGYYYSLYWETLNVNFNIDDNDPPNIPSIPSGPSSRDVGESGTYSTSTIDPNGDQVQYRFDWDADGSHDYSSWTLFVNSGQSSSKSHSWGTAGTYKVKAQAKDAHGLESGWSSGKTVVVTGGGDNDPPNIPSIPSGPSSRDVGESGTYSTSTIDPNGDQVQYRFDWDADGIGDISDWTSLGSSGHTASLSHSWDSSGTYVVRAQAKDEYGAQSGWSSGKTVVVIEGGGNDPPNKPTLSGETNGRVGKSYIYSAFTVDPDGDKVFYWFDWDDGTNSGWKGSFNSGETCGVSHIWDVEGSYSLKVKAKDEYGEESEWSDPLRITMPRNRLINNPIFTKFIDGFIDCFPLFARLLRFL